MDSIIDPSFSQLIWIDYCLLGVILISAIIGLFRGFIKEAFSLLTWLVAIWLGLRFSQPFSLYFNDYIDLPSVRIGVAFMCLLIVTLILGSMLSFLISQIIDKTGLSGTDRFVGFLFGIVRGMVVISLVVLLAGLTPLPQDPWWSQSLLIEPFQELSVWLRAQIPEGITEYFSY